MVAFFCYFRKLKDFAGNARHLYRKKRYLYCNDKNNVEAIFIMSL